MYIIDSSLTAPKGALVEATAISTLEKVSQIARRISDRTKIILGSVEHEGTDYNYTQQYRWPCGDRSYKLFQEDSKVGMTFYTNVTVSVTKGHDVFKLTHDDGGFGIVMNEVRLMGPQTALTRQFAELVAPLLETISRELDMCQPPLPKGVDPLAERIKEAKKLDAGDALKRMSE